MIRATTSEPSTRPFGHVAVQIQLPRPRAGGRGELRGLHGFIADRRNLVPGSILDCVILEHRNNRRHLERVPRSPGVDTKNGTLCAFGRGRFYDAEWRDILSSSTGLHQLLARHIY
jgi:hypothetical protein